MQNALNSVKVAAPATNAFDLSHDVKLSMQMGQLVPVLAMECIPGDRVRIGCENLIRLAPMLAPMMHRVDVRVEYFFVPNRLIWEQWEVWITNGGSNNVQVDPLPEHPYIYYNVAGTGGAQQYNRLMDYLGLPDPAQGPDPTHRQKISALPFAAYGKIFNDYYRDENLIAEATNSFTLLDGNNSANGDLVVLRNRAWEADYFTKALPFAQKGQPVDLPMGSGLVEFIPGFTGGDPRFVDTVGAQPAAGNIQNATDRIFSSGAAATDLAYDPDGSLGVNLAATTINDLRLAYRLQEWLEKNARGGTRYSELIRSHFNVRPEDARLQRPEYIVGIKNPIQISEVLNTTGTDNAAQGTMAGHGVSYNKGNYGKYFCTEHGYIIGLMSVMPKTAYQQGVPKHFMKYTDPTELAWPSFANLGEQPIQNREIMAFQGDPIETATFGYTPRYMEYKNLPSRVCGEFRTTLDFWHMGRIFFTGTPPVLNGDFVTADPTQRIFAVTDPEVDQLYCQVMHHIHVVRALPFYGTPTF